MPASVGPRLQIGRKVTVWENRVRTLRVRDPFFPQGAVPDRTATRNLGANSQTRPKRGHGWRWPAGPTPRHPHRAPAGADRRAGPQKFPGEIGRNAIEGFPGAAESACGGTRGALSSLRTGAGDGTRTIGKHLGGSGARAAKRYFVRSNTARWELRVMEIALGAQRTGFARAGP